MATTVESFGVQKAAIPEILESVSPEESARIEAAMEKMAMDVARGIRERASSGIAGKFIRGAMHKFAQRLKEYGLEPHHAPEVAARGVKRAIKEMLS